MCGEVQALAKLGLRSGGCCAILGKTCFCRWGIPIRLHQHTEEETHYAHA